MLTATRNARTRQLSRGAIAAGLAALGLVGLAAPASAENYRLVKTYGSGGEGDGQFKNPGGVVLGSENTRETVIVADTINSRIQVLYADDGSLARKWGTEGSGNTELSAPEGIARDSAGNVWVADTGNHRVYVFDAGGTFLRKFGSHKRGDDDVWDPAGIAVNPAGNVIVAHNGFSESIVEFDPTGTFIRKLPGRQFHRPSGLTTDAAGNLFVADSDNFEIKKMTLSPELTVKNSAASQGNFGYVVNGTTIAANHPAGMQETILIERGIDVTVSEIDGAGGFSVASYTVSVDCGAACRVIRMTMRTLREESRLSCPSTQSSRETGPARAPAGELRRLPPQRREPGHRDGPASGERERRAHADLQPLGLA